MIPAELQQRDEELTAAGHDPECAAFDDRECSCEIGQPAPKITKVGRMKHPAVQFVDPAQPSITLVGPEALAFERYQAASRDLLLKQAAYKQAGDEFTAAHQAFADLVAKR